MKSLSYNTIIKVKHQKCMYINIPTPSLNSYVFDPVLTILYGLSIIFIPLWHSKYAVRYSEPFRNT